jgi:hypothetical protein
MANWSNSAGSRLKQRSHPSGATLDSARSVEPPPTACIILIYWLAAAVVVVVATIDSRV